MGFTISTYNACDLTYADFYENAQTIFRGEQPKKPDFTTYKPNVGMWE